MVDVRMHPTVRNKSYQMQFFALLLCMFESVLENFVIAQGSLHECLVYFYKILINNTSCSDIHVTHLRVAHLALRQPYSQPRSLESAVRIPAIQAVNKRRIRLVYS